MSQPPRPVARHVPTLTEVIEVEPQALPSPDIDVPLGVPDLSHHTASADVTAEAAVVPPAATVVTAPVVPTLTDVDRAVIPRSMLSDAGFQAVVGGGGMPAASPLSAAPSGATSSSAPVPVAIDEQAIVQKVHADLQRQIDGMLEYRLREAIGPILARTSELLVRELRQELGKTMKDVVARSVAQEIARQRSRSGS